VPREEVPGELVGIAADGLEEADDPLLVGDVLVPHAADLVDECSPGGMPVTERECCRLEKGQ